MADLTKNFYKVSPNAGNGNANLTITSTAAHTGRVKRTQDFTIKTTQTPQVSKTVTVEQSPKAEFINIAIPATQQASATSVVITGESNSAALYIKFNADLSGRNNSPTILINAETAARALNASLAGDPGATAQYSFKIPISIPENTSAKSRSFNIELYNINPQSWSAANPSHKKATVTITQNGAAPTLTTDKASVTLGSASGASGSVAVTSNADWTVS